MKENKITIIILTLFILIMLAISISCKGNTEDKRVTYSSPDTCIITSSAATDSMVAEIWGVTPEQVELVNTCLNWAFQNEAMYIDLLCHDENLVNLIESPRHAYCLECKLKALKFCFNHRLFDDTVGEMEQADWLYTLDDELKSSHPSEFALWWARIDWNY